jgi:hypothetical protein
MPTGTRPDPPGGVARVAVQGTIWGHEWINVVYVKPAVTGTPDATDVMAIADGVGGAWAADFMPLLDAHTALTQSKAVYFPTSGTPIVAISPASASGGIDSQLADAGACFVIDWVIDASYRGGHPRTYLAGVPTSDISNGSDVHADVRAALAGAAAAVMVTVEAIVSAAFATCQLGTVSYSVANAWRTPPIFRAYSGAVCGATLGSQRRRIHS